MQTSYEPDSEFLRWVMSEEAPLVGLPFADVNLQRIMELLKAANRDWATFLLAQQAEIDTPVVREALQAAANAVDPIVRGEAFSARRCGTTIWRSIGVARAGRKRVGHGPSLRPPKQSAILHYWIPCANGLRARTQNG